MRRPTYINIEKIYRIGIGAVKTYFSAEESPELELELESFKALRKIYLERAAKTLPKVGQAVASKITCTGLMTVAELIPDADSAKPGTHAHLQKSLDEHHSHEAVTKIARDKDQYLPQPSDVKLSLGGAHKDTTQLEQTASGEKVFSESAAPHSSWLLLILMSLLCSFIILLPRLAGLIILFFPVLVGLYTLIENKI